MYKPSKIVENQQKAYQSRFLEHGDSAKGVYWNDPRTQQLRFERLLPYYLSLRGREEPFSVHEIGCGMCAFHEFLRMAHIGHDYSGTDIVPEMVSASKKKYPDIEVYERNILQDHIEETYDLVVVSGVFNLRAETKPKLWQRYIEEMILKMYELSTEAIAFNFLTSDITVPPDSTLHYIDPRKMLLFCQENLSRFINLDQTMPLYEVTVTVLKPEFAERCYSEEAFAKYFGE